jgi:hypothetical protein
VGARDPAAKAGWLALAQSWHDLASDIEGQGSDGQYEADGHKGSDGHDGSDGPNGSDGRRA